MYNKILNIFNSEILKMLSPEMLIEIKDSIEEVNGFTIEEFIDTCLDSSKSPYGMISLASWGDINVSQGLLDDIERAIDERVAKETSRKIIVYKKNSRKVKI